MATSSSKTVEVFTGREDVNKFITKCDLHCNIKDYVDEKKAAFIASKLEVPAFDIYMSLSDEGKKDPEAIKTALVNSFDNAKRNREVAIEELMNRKRLTDEKPEVFAHKIQELVKHAYTDFTDEAKARLAKDYYVKGLSVDTQKDLRKMNDFDTLPLTELVKKTTYLEIANANSTTSQTEQVEIASVSSRNSDAKLDRLINLMERSLGSGDELQEESVNYSGESRGTNYRQNRRGNGRGNGRRGGATNRQPQKCRVCNSTEHLFRKCPQRFCQTCGGKGHDGWDRECPKYQ